mmetsp:Transcript_17386/g.35083  ORF Transcript_17386/g.35083 Transcript_17386/m.35083 type:complete len:277 (+) Transcript_17386:494-1324(+)
MPLSVFSRTGHVSPSLSSLHAARAVAPMRCAARRCPMMFSSDIISSYLCGVSMYFSVAARPSTSTFFPSWAILARASFTNTITSPCVTRATFGMFVATCLDLSRVLFTFDTRSLYPKPLISTSKPSSNLSNVSMAMKDWRFSGFKASSSSTFFSSANLAASRVIDRKMSPLDHVMAFGSFSFSLATVVPFPVPERPSRVMTQPDFGASPSFSTISSATSSAVLPITSTMIVSASSLSFGNTFLSMASCMPSFSFLPSSSSRFLISFVVSSASCLKP